MFIGILIDRLPALVSLAILIPLTMLAWAVTGGPNGDHGSVFWLATVIFALLAAASPFVLPPPWNGRSPNEPSPQAERQHEVTARRLLDERGSQLDPERANDVRLLLEAGFARDAEELLLAETTPNSPDMPNDSGTRSP